MPTKIPYCDEVLEVTGGCTKCASGCQHCWAIKEVWRMAHNPLLGDKWKGLVEKTPQGLSWTGKIKCFEDVLQIPLKRKKPTTYFIDSKADLFYGAVPFGFIHKVLRVIEQCEQHTFQILTKRPKIAYDFFGGTNGAGLSAPPLPNLWLGITAENQKAAYERIPILLQIPAAIHFVSIEPMLGWIELWKSNRLKTHNFLKQDGLVEKEQLCGAFGEISQVNITVKTGKLDWVIIGCESINGKAGRFQDGFNEAAINLVGQCKAAGVSPFVKQVSYKGKVLKRNPDGTYPKGWSEELQVQECL